MGKGGKPLIGQIGVDGGKTVGHETLILLAPGTRAIPQVLGPGRGMCNRERKD